MENIEPEHWAHQVWDAEHIIASALQPGQLSSDIKTSALARVYSLCHMTPCETCRGHYNTFVQSSPPHFETDEDVERWWLSVHNYVSRILGKREWTIAQLRQKYPRNGNYPSPQNTTKVTYPLVRYANAQQKTASMLGYSSNTQAQVQAVTASAKQVPLPGFTKPIANIRPGQSKQRTFQTAQAIPKANQSWQQRYVRTRNGVGIQTLQWRSMSKKKSGSGLPKKKGCSSCRKRAP